MVTGSAAEKRLFLARLAEARDASEGGLQARRLNPIGVGLMLLLFVAIAAMLWLSMTSFFATPKEVLEIRARVDEQIVQLEKVARHEAPLTYDTSVLRQSLERVREMPPAVRAQVRSEMDRLGRARDKAERQSYFAIPPTERRAELDRRIKAEESRRQAAQQRSVSRSKARGSQGDRAGNGQGSAGSGSAKAAAAIGAGVSPVIRGGSEEERNARRKQRLDTSSPEERAQSAEYRRAMEARRQQLGLRSGRGGG